MRVPLRRWIVRSARDGKTATAKRLACRDTTASRSDACGALASYRARSARSTFAALLLALGIHLHAAGLEPRGRIHIPIGTPDTLDTLKTFVEAEGNFSPGFATCGVSFRIYDPEAHRFSAPTQDGVPHQRGLLAPGVLIPWTTWRAGQVEVRSEVCQTQRGDAQIVGARVRLKNSGEAEKLITLYAVVSALGAAGAPIYELGIEGDAIFANHEPMLISTTKPDAGEAPAPGENDSVLAIAKLPPNPSTRMRSGECDGSLRFEVKLAPGETKTFGFVCPVLHGRRAAPHLWDGASQWAQLDDADPVIGTQGVQQPSPGVDFYRAIKPDDLFAEAENYWRKFRGEVQLDLPDPRWAEAFHAIAAHAAMCLNDGAPDVAVINYNVFNRDGVYVANILQKSGNFPLAREIIDYFLRHPFNGRVQPEADNPGQILWLLGEHWRFTGDHAWLESVWPGAKRIAAMIEYYRTTPEPHWVSVNGIDFGEQVPDGDRLRLKPGTCDGFHPEYTEAFDLAGLRAVTTLAAAMGDDAARTKWSALREQFMRTYDERFGADLRKHEYANYSALWPCRLYPLGGELFHEVGAQAPKSWRYFPLALAHQGLLAGNREAASGTIAKHLELDSMRGWYALDEGGPSAPGNWGKVKSNWKVEAKGPHGAGSAAAMPHGWAIAEFHLLLRDALVFEDENKLVLFAGVPPEWFAKPMRLRNLPTHFGTLSVEWTPGEHEAVLRVSGDATPPGGLIVRSPAGDAVFADWTQPLHVRATP
jgi:hypothetical protein